MTWLVFRGTDWNAVTEALVHADRRWIALAVCCAFGGQFLRAERLAFILRARVPIPFRDAFHATQIGMLMNVVLPLRIGEGVRILVLARASRVGLSNAVASAVVDRVTDMVALFVIVATAALASPVFDGIRIAPGMLQNAEEIVVPASALSGIVVSLSVLLSAALLGLLLVRLNPQLVLRIAQAVARPFPRAVAERALAVVASLSHTAGQMASARVMAGAVALSLAAWSVGLVSLYGLLSAFGLDVPWPAPFLMMSLIAAFVAAPLTPGLVGQYHVPVLAGVLLVDPDVAVSTAKAATIMGHLLFLLPVSVLGIVSLLGSRLGPAELFRRGVQGGIGTGAARTDQPRGLD